MYVCQIIYILLKKEKITYDYDSVYFILLSSGCDAFDIVLFYLFIYLFLDFTITITII